MLKQIGAITAIIALAATAFTAAYLGGGLLTKADPDEPAGAALRAPQLSTSTPATMVTPTATPSPRPTGKKKKHKKKATPKKWAATVT
jgi:hypothetical protein